MADGQTLFDPNQLAMFGLAGGALAAIGKLGQGFQASAIDQLQQSIAQQNVTLLTTRAGLEAKEGDLAYAQGGLESARTVAAINRTVGTEVSRVTGANLDPTVGSPLVAAGFSAAQGRADLDLIAARARMGAAGALMQSAGTMAQAAGAQGQATAFGMKSSQDIMSGYLGAATTLVSSIGNIAGKFGYGG